MMPEPMTVATRNVVPRNSAVILLWREIVDIVVNGRTWKGKTPRPRAEETLWNKGGIDGRTRAARIKTGRSRRMQAR